MEVSPNRSTVRGPNTWFTGEVWIDARTAWHRHSIGQTLQISAGEGRVQSRDQDIVVVRPGDAVVTPGGEWHWHGAAPDRFMTHLSITEGDTDWGDHLTDAEYQGK